ncbi:MAG: 2-C-methyl-D-erythritol 4-phosphate cytidylyltransferase [Prevotella sp.]|nr:2-C-methyl-D-erythritol 4-phosphate cytidylyltransferase [Prevotella sp.]
MNIAVVLAGGSGLRLGGDIPKQFLEVDGKPIIAYTIEAFERNPHIDEIAVVSRPENVDLMWEIVRRFRYVKVKKVLVGGKERYDSSLAAIAAYDNPDDVLLLHDGVRPLVSQQIIDRCVEAMKGYNAVGVAVKTTDTIVEVDQQGRIVATPSRTSLRNMQTPQCFRHGVIRKAYEVALHDPAFITTDDCGVVAKYLPDVPVLIVEGEASNIKVTYKEDLALMRQIFQKDKHQPNNPNRQ